MAIRDVYKSAEDAFNRHDADGFVSMFAADAVVYAPNSPDPLRRREAIRKDIDGWFTAFPDGQIKYVRILSEGDTAAVEAEMSGTNTGPLVGPMGTIPPTNRRITLQGAAIARFNAQEQILEERRYFDTASMMAQLGIAPGS